MKTLWLAEKGVIIIDQARRVPIANSHGRPDAALAGQVVAIHNEQLEQLHDDIHAAALENDRLKAAIAQAEQTRNAAQAEATRQTLLRQELLAGFRKACRVGPAGDCLGVIYRLQRLGDAVRSLVQAEGRP